MKFLIGGVALIVLWILGLFVARIEAGWLHALLATGAVLIAVGIVVATEERRPR